jgi:hypothetical protein
LLDSTGALEQGERWYKRHAATPEAAVAQLAADLGKDAKFEEAFVVEAPDLTVVRQETRWGPVRMEG